MAASSPLQTEFYEPDWTVGYALKRVQTLDRRDGAGYVFVSSDGSERSYTFEEIEVAVTNRAKHLLSRGLKKGDRVGIIVPDPEEFVLTFFAYDAMQVAMHAFFGADSFLQSPFWFVLEGAIVGLFIGYSATKFGGEGPETVKVAA